MAITPVGIRLQPGSYSFIGKTDAYYNVSLATVADACESTSVMSNYSNGQLALANYTTSSSTNNLVSKWNTGDTKTMEFVCYFTEDVYNEIGNLNSSVGFSLTKSDDISVSLYNNFSFGTFYSWNTFSQRIESAVIERRSGSSITWETIYGLTGAVEMPINLTASNKSYEFTIKLMTSVGIIMTLDYTPVNFEFTLNLAPYTYSTAYAMAWNTTNVALGPINPGSSKTITCTLKNNERTDSYAASTSGRIYVSAINLINATPNVFMPNTDGSCWLNKNGTTYPTSIMPFRASGTGSYSSTTSTSASISCTAVETYIAPQVTSTFTVTLTAPSIAAQRRYYNSRLTFKCVGATSDTTETMTDYFYSNGMTPSGSYKLRSLSNYRVLDFQTDVENAGSASVTSTGTQPILSTNYNANYTGHLAYDGSTAALSPRFKCIDESKTIVTANEYVSSGPTPTILRTCSSCGHTQSVSTGAFSWTCASCGATNFVPVGGNTLTMALNANNCNSCNLCNINCLNECPLDILVLGPNDISNADACVDCGACFTAGLNTICPVNVKFLIQSPLSDL